MPYRVRLYRLRVGRGTNGTDDVLAEGRSIDLIEEAISVGRSLPACGQTRPDLEVALDGCPSDVVDPTLARL